MPDDNNPIIDFRKDEDPNFQQYMLESIREDITRNTENLAGEINASRKVQKGNILDIPGTSAEDRNKASDDIDHNFDIKEAEVMRPFLEKYAREHGMEAHELVAFAESKNFDLGVKPQWAPQPQPVEVEKGHNETPQTTTQGQFQEAAENREPEQTSTTDRVPRQEGTVKGSVTPNEFNAAASIEIPEQRSNIDSRLVYDSDKQSGEVDADAMLGEVDWLYTEGEAQANDYEAENDEPEIE